MVSSIAAAGLFKGVFHEDMFDEAQDPRQPPYFRTKHESERVVREECEPPWRVYRPGIVVGDSRTGEIDKVDGPYYFFKLMQPDAATRCRSGSPMIGVEGGDTNLVPVDFVAKAMDHIAHQDGLDGQAFHLTDPNPRRPPGRSSTSSLARARARATIRLDPKMRRARSLAGAPRAQTD